MKEKLVDHLQTQIQDLERFVEFLQGEAEGMKRIVSALADRFRPSTSTGKLCVERVVVGGFIKLFVYAFTRLKTSLMLARRYKHFWFCTAFLTPLMIKLKLFLSHIGCISRLDSFLC